MVPDVGWNLAWTVTVGCITLIILTLAVFVRNR